MQNEILLIASLLFSFSGVIIWFSLFGRTGLKCLNCVYIIAANIEVLILVHAFGMDMTLGNTLFAATFLITDILSELYGEKESAQAVYTGALASLFFVGLSQLWLLFAPAEGDFAFPAIQTIFKNTPRLILSSLIVNLIVQRFDVWAYHAIWKATERKSGSRKKFLWLRNNGSTLCSQLLNTVLFNFTAFWGIYDVKTIISIIISCYAIFIVTSLADTPFIYLARRIYEKKNQKNKLKAAEVQN